MPQSNYRLIMYLVGFLFLSCTKDTPYDITGDPEVKFFTNNESPGNAPVNSINYSVVNIPNTTGSGLLNLSTTLPATIKIPVFATRNVTDDVIIGAALDNDLIAQYNAANNTNYVPFPHGFLNTGALSASIAKGSNISSDSIAVGINQAGLNALTDEKYMAPIKLTTVSKPGVGGITGNTSIQVAYIVANVELRKIKYLALASEVVGSLISPRSSWALTFTPSPTSTGGNGSVLDGSTTSYSRFGTSPVQVDVNMQSAKNVTGIRLYTSNNATHIPTQVEVSLSNDGINYNVIGAPLRANLTYASSYNYILFYNPIPAQYVRLRLFYTTSTNTQNTRVTELDVYAN